MNEETIRLLNTSYKDAVKNGEYREWQDAESESFWYRYISPHYKHEEQTLMLLPDTGDFCMDDLYYDQAMKRGWRSFSIYTPDGLKHKEQWMIKQICNENRKYTLNDLEKMVRQNPHYHDTIKVNLIYNINNYK
jgi:hypothetical protein